MGILAAVAALLAAGAVYQRVGLLRHRRQFAPPGRLVDVGGHRLHATCRGEGSPMVVLEAGIAASSVSWALVEPLVATFTRVCAYDRAGLGWSDVPSCTRTFDRIVDDLAALLDRVAPGERCVLAGHSFGCFVVRAYAHRRPERVAGVVLVDPPLEWLAPTPERRRRLRGARQLSRLGGWLAHVGVVRACLALLLGGAPGAPRQFVKLFGPTVSQTLGRLVGEVRKLPPELHPTVQALWCQPKCFEAMGAYLQTLERDVAALGAAAPPPAVPLIVISGAHQTAEELAAHRAVAAAATTGRHVTASGSGHWILFDEPAIVVRAIRDLVEGARAAG